jgi:phosphotransferase system enzyme I (PtsI)
MNETKTFKGIGVSPGVIIGSVIVVKDERVIVAHCLLEISAIEDEIQKLLSSIQQTREQLEDLRKKIAEKINLEHSFIFDAQLLMLEDDNFIGQIIKVIQDEKINVEWAIEKINLKYIQAFENIQDDYLKERGLDIRDVSRRLISNLGSQSTTDLHKLKEPGIIISRDMHPSDFSALDHSKVLGLAIEVGGKTSHVGLLARSLEIPTLVGLNHVVNEVKTGDIAIIDGDEDLLIINPSESLLNEYRNKKDLLLQVESKLILNRNLPAVTLDGYEVELRANIDLPIEVASAIDHGARGIGLFRSEFLFLQNPSQITDENVHYHIYRHLLEESPYSNTIRILDIGSDKEVTGHKIEKELNPALGLRSIRLFLQKRDIIIAQLRGMLRASIYGKLEILIPFVSGITEVNQVKELIIEIKEDFIEKKMPFDENIKIGIMIEIPSAAIIAESLAKTVDFFSVGTNDLIQYTLAIDRSNKHVSYLYRPLHPAIIRLLSIIIKAGRSAGIPVSVCGEVAADPVSLMILLGMKYPILSMNAVSIPLIKNIIRSIKQSDAAMITEKISTMKTALEAEEYLLEQITARFPRGFQPLD